MQCRHFHSHTEWDPHHCADGSTWYPSKEEAEYTAALVFHIAVAVSWWAGRLGKAKLRVPRAPPVDCVGDRIKWLQLDKKAMREWMMIPMALAIGLVKSELAEITKEFFSASRPASVSCPGTVKSLLLNSSQTFDWLSLMPLLA